MRVLSKTIDLRESMGKKQYNSVMYDKSYHPVPACESLDHFVADGQVFSLALVASSM